MSGSEKKKGKKTNMTALMGFWRLSLINVFDVSVCWKMTISGFCLVGCGKYGKKKIMLLLAVFFFFFFFCTSYW
jgi:hypothetical protein